MHYRYFTLEQRDRLERALHEQLAASGELAEALARLGVTHTFEIYDGDHGNRIRERFESQVLRCFSQHLSAR